MGSASNVASNAGGTLQSAQSSVGDTATDVADRAREAPQWVAQETRGNPLVAGMVAFGVGLLLGSIAPPTEVERHAVDAMSDQIEPVRQKAMEAAGSVREEVTDATREASQHVKEQAQDAAQEVQSTAQHSVSQVKEQSQAAAHEVGQARNRDA
jgi:ElaB/YqjD/DUF883 family membrane-anchored ribosome-binding protein